MCDRLWVRCVFLLIFGIVSLSSYAAATSQNYVYVGSGRGQLYGVDVDTGVVRLLTTSTESNSINSIGARL